MLFILVDPMWLQSTAEEAVEELGNSLNLQVPTEINVEGDNRELQYKVSQKIPVKTLIIVIT